MLEAIRTLCKNCTLCSLGRSLHEVNGRKIEPHVLSNMNPSKYVVMGQNPGFNECVQDQPFVGQSGDTFNKEIAKYGLTRKHFYITNILHCHTPGNRRPLPEELTACRPLVEMELLHLRPKLIITLGKFAFNALCPDEHYGSSLGAIKHAKVAGYTWNVYPVYHPSGMNLSDKNRRDKFEKDIELVCKLINHWESDNES